MKSNKSLIAVIVLLAIIVFLGWFFWDILVYMILALALSFLGKPLMRLLAKINIKGWQFPVSAAAAITLIVIIGVLFTAGYFLIPVVIHEMESILTIDPTALNGEFTTWLNKLDPTLYKFGFLDAGQHFSTIVTAEIQNIFDEIDMSNIVSNTFNAGKAIVIGAFSVLFMTFFALKDHGIFFRMIKGWIPTDYRDNFSNILDATGIQLSSYFIGVFIDMLLVGTIEFVLCLLFGVPNALLIGVLGGTLNIIPFVGPIIAGVAAVIISLTSLIPANPEGALLFNTLLKVVLIFIATKGVDDFVLQPVIYGKRTQTHPLEIFVVILMAGYVGGVFAMIFAVPAYTLIRIVVKEFFGNYFFGEEKGAETIETSAEKRE